MIRRVIKIFLKTLFAFFLISFISTLIFRWVPIPLTPLMLIRCAEQKGDGKSFALHKTWVTLDQISPHLQLAVVCSEDQHFLLHFGFDFEALKKAMIHNKNSKRIRGGSTISQQTAKNVFLWDGRNYIRKGLEAYFTLLIEALWSKERIMEVYLNIVELGNGIYGAEYASQFYFRKSASRLTKEEAAILSTLLPSPLRYGKNLKSPYLQERKKWVLRQMNFWGGKLNYTLP